MGDQTHALFNHKTIERLCSYVKITDEESRAMSKWLALLKTDALGAEKKNYFRFAIIVLKDVLGYNIEEDLNFEEGNVEFSFVHPVTKKSVCIEVKGTLTKDLFSNQNREKPEHQTPIKQTWDYMGSGNFDYGIATNYRDFVLIDKTKGYSKYHLFDFMSLQGNLTKFKEFLAIFSHDSLLGTGILLKLYEESILEEREFTKEFYKLFHETRLMLIKEFQTDRQLTREEAVHYAQVFLNRLIFMFFAEDTGKIRKRLFSESVLDSLKLSTVSKFSKYACDTIVNLFEQLDKGSDRSSDIFGFNGGLFREKIDGRVFFNDLKDESYFSDVLQYSTLKKNFTLDEFSQKVVEKFKKTLNPITNNLLILSSFDFHSDLNVNILGHIFEQSLTDLEELQTEEKISKKKKEGVFYTPQYVTEYICKNTIIPYLSRSGTNKIEDLIEEYSDNIEALELKFKKLKLLDPACGSGAFLLQSIDVLLDIHKEIQLFKESHGNYIVTKKSKKRGRTTVAEYYTLKRWNEQEEARKIIENNIFGVDINDESVEITKLSLFLKIASTNRKLIDLSDNIRVGNSLISDAALDNKALDWKTQFEKIFRNNGGFDIIIGNPPYVSQKGTTNNPNIEYDEREYYRQTYKSLSQDLSTRGGVKLNLFALWIERAINLLAPKGTLGLIVHKNLLKVESYKFLRKFILENTSISEIFDLGGGVFENVTGETIILTLKNETRKGNKIMVKENINLANNQFKHGLISQDTFINTLDNMFNIYHDDTLERLKEKISHQSLKLEECYNIISFGLNTKDNKKFFSTHPSEGNWKKAVMGRHVGKWLIKSLGYVLYEEKVLTRTGDVKAFESTEKIILQRIGTGLVAAYDDKQLYCYNSTNMILAKDNRYELKYLLCLLNSKLINYYYVNAFSMKASLTVNITQGYLSQIPIKNISREKQASFVALADQIIRSYDDFYTKKTRFLNRVNSAFHITKNQKINEFYEINFIEFLKEVRMLSPIQLSLKEQDEWERYFEEYKEDLCNLRAHINKLQRDVDELVYAIYGLSSDEKRHIEVI